MTTPERGLARLGFALGVVALVMGCTQEPFDAPVTFQGVEVAAETLNLGRQTFQSYCRPCHGVNGDGAGPASKGLRPSPRDFTQGVFKFARVEVGTLPTDQDLQRIIHGGLDGTAMLAWDLSDQQLHAVVQYIKTFSEVWQDPDERVGQLVALTEDPWVDNAAAAVDLGRRLYHGLAQCGACHPSYATYEDIVEARIEFTGHAPDDLGPSIYAPRLDASQYASPKLVVPPPDFTWHRMRVARDLEQLYLTIAAGIGGTAMPTWDGALPGEQLWALAYYVQSLIELRRTPQAEELRRHLASQPSPGYSSSSPSTSG